VRQKRSTAWWRRRAASVALSGKWYNTWWRRCSLATHSRSQCQHPVASTTCSP
jgi:hypothetical protein